MEDILYNMFALEHLKGKQYLITGGSKGIGKETASILSKLGAKVIIIDRNELEATHAIEHFNNSTIHKFYKFDFSKVNEIEMKIQKILNENGPLDGFIHCVGARSRRPLSLLNVSSIQEILNVNFVSFIEMIRIICKKNNHNSGLSIVGVSSIASTVGHKSVTAYAASKAAMDSSIRCLAKELAVKGIRFNSVVPSVINTEVYRSFISNDNQPNPENSISDRQYLGLGQPIDVANTIIFLLSPESRFITGSAISVDGGFLS